MRNMVVIVAASLVSACGAPGPDNSGDSGVSVENAAPAAVEDAANGQSDAPPNATGPADVLPRPASPCLIQGSDKLQVAPIRAVGTEPFWAARVEGRCVTYSTPENQQGTRVWTRYVEQGGGQGAWIGQLDGKKFEMRVRPEAGCSDGMSDQRYPLAVELAVHGETRTGCAERL